jgi:hypothetical protein
MTYKMLVDLFVIVIQLSIPKVGTPITEHLSDYRQDIALLNVRRECKRPPEHGGFCGNF